jgi:hypothetical protein
MRPIFFSDTVNAEGYNGQILAPFFKNLSVKENEYMFFQQGSLTAYTANNSMATLRNSFGNV